MYLTQCITCATGDVEYWNENDSDIDEDFSMDVQSDVDILTAQPT